MKVRCLLGAHNSLPHHSDSFECACNYDKERDGTQKEIQKGTNRDRRGIGRRETRERERDRDRDMRKGRERKRHEEREREKEP